MSPQTVKEQFKLACNESTPTSELTSIWGSSRSVKVRKAIASNPNASPDTLKIAARLYLEEVIENPGFTLLELFNDDPWILKISKAYTQPWEFLIKHGGSIYSKVGSFDYFGWAILLSPQLEASSLDRAILFMSAQAFRRAIKNPRVLDKIRGIYNEAPRVNSVWSFSLESLTILYREGAIGEEELIYGLKNYGTGSESSRKMLFTKYIKKIYQLYYEGKTSYDKEIAVTILAHTFNICRAHVIRWVLTSDLLYFDAERWSGELYSSVLSCLSKINKNIKSKKLFNAEAMRACEKITARHIFKFLLKDDFTREGFNSVYAFIKSKDLCEMRFGSVGLIIPPGLIPLEELNKCDINVKNFFCRTGSLGDWVGTTGSDMKYQIINEVNEYFYDRDGVEEGTLLFNKCSIRKVVSLQDNCYVV